MEKKSLKVVKFYKASPAKVFAAWSSVDEIKKWFAPQPGTTLPICEVDFKVGGKYRIGFASPDGSMKNPDGSTPVASGEYKEIVPDKTIKFTWRWEAWPMEMGTTLVTVELAEKDGGTELTLTHEDLSNDESVQSHTQGWNGCLESLAKSL